MLSSKPPEALASGDRGRLRQVQYRVPPFFKSVGTGCPISLENLVELTLTMAVRVYTQFILGIRELGSSGPNG